jgi:hypothetical protein
MYTSANLSGIKSYKRRKSTLRVQAEPVQNINPYLERIRKKSVEHPLKKVPEFCRFDMSTKNGRHFLPEENNEREENELLNSEIFRAYFEKVFHDQSKGYLSVSIVKRLSSTKSNS